MKELVLLAVLAAVAALTSGAQLSCTCGWRNTGRIIGGKVTLKNEYPWMVAIQRKSSRSQFCGGAIITPWHVVSAAHCFKNTSPADVVVSVGAHDVHDFEDETAQLIDVAEIYNHPDYNRTSTGKDISVLVLANKIKFNQYVGPACFPDRKIADDLAGQYIKAMGWGRVVWNTPNNGAVKELKEVDLQVVTASECKKYWSILSDHSQICTYTPSLDTCNGDSGGPLVWLDPETNRYTIVALVSYGAVICGSERPAVNTNVSHYRSWVNGIIAATKPGVRVCSKQ